MDKLFAMFERLLDALERIVAALETKAPAQPGQPGTPETPAPADPGKVEPTPGPAEPEPAPQPEPEPEPQPEPDPEPQPEPDPEPQPEPEPAPQPEPAPEVQFPAGMLAPGKMERVSGDWKKGQLALPSWHNGVHTTGNPRFVTFDADGSALLSAWHIGEEWNSGKLQTDRPKAGKGLWSFVMSSDLAEAVLAMFAFCNDSHTEIDWEYGIKDGRHGWHLAVHMPKKGGGRVSLGGFIPFSQERVAGRHLYEFELTDDSCRWMIDGEEVLVRHRWELPKGEVWKTDAKMFAMCSVEKHDAWAGWPAYEEASMRVHGIRVPGMIPAA